MTRKQQRLTLLLVSMAVLGGAVALVLSAFSSNLVFFYSPSQLKAEPMLDGRRVRIGGLVEAHSLQRDGRKIRFRVTDGKHAVEVKYRGALPDLFREGQGVVVEGKLLSDGMFAASTVLAKHDAKYMPPEVVAELKKTGHWKEGQPGGAPIPKISRTSAAMPSLPPGMAPAK